MKRNAAARGDLETEIAALEELDLDGLRRRWRDVVGSPPPLCRSPHVFRLEIAWRLQTAQHGDLDVASRRKLRTLANPKPTTEVAEPTQASSLPIGSTLLREWRGETHRVKVTAEGFEHRGATHRSLSAVARKITGARWSGPRFFQLTEAAS